MSNAGQARINLYLEAPSGERFEIEVALDQLLYELAAAFFQLRGWPLERKEDGGQRPVVELVDPENPGDTRRLDGRLTVGESGLRSGDILRIFPEAIAGGYRAERSGEDSTSALTPVSRSQDKEMIRRYTDVSFPKKARVGQATNLRVQIVTVSGRHPHDIPIDLEVSDQIRVTVYVTAENFSIQGNTHAEILVPRAGDSKPIHFLLTGEEVGPGRIMLDFVQDGRPLGSIDLEPTVVTGDQPQTQETASPQGEIRLRAGEGPAPAVTIFVHEYRTRRGRLHFSLFSDDPRLRDVPMVAYGDLGTVDLNANVADWVSQQLECLNNDAAGPAWQGNERLAEVGNRLFQQLLPVKLQELCWTLTSRGVFTVMIFTDDPHIPWELLKPCRLNSSTPEMEQLPFWGESFALGRWLRGPATTDRFVLDRVCAVATGGKASHRDFDPQAVQRMSRPEPVPLNKEAKLDNMEKELEVIRSLTSQGAHVRILEAHRGAVREALQQADFDLFHLVSHGAFGGMSRADASAVLLEDGVFTAGELPPSMTAALRQSAPLIFFNACNTGRIGYSLTQLGSWGAELIRLGCGGFVGTLWRVTDDAALAFAEIFYGLLAKGLPIGDALWKTRLSVRGQFPNDPTWLAYCCFADPTARVDKADKQTRGSSIGPACR